MTTQHKNPSEAMLEAAGYRKAVARQQWRARINELEGGGDQ